MHADPELHLQVRKASVPACSPTVAFAIVAGCVIAVLAVFWPTTWSMIEIWQRSETYQHCFAVIPLSLWLVWKDRARIARTTLEPWWPGLLLVGAMGSSWVMGQLAIASVVAHFAIIALIPAVVLTICGLGWFRVLLFPMGFMFFAVPFGEALVPKLMQWTADVTVRAVMLSGVPVHQEGMHFVVPTGRWSVIEACSGLKFLIASSMVGTLYAWLTYRSMVRRLAFVAAAILVPLLANWVRAYSIVMLGHLTNNSLMTGHDHVVFGWFLFAVCILLMFWVGSFWREDAQVERHAALAGVAGSAGSFRAARFLSAVAAAFSALFVFIALESLLEQSPAGAAAVRMTAVVGENGWSEIGQRDGAWVPELVGPSATQRQVFRQNDAIVGVYLAAFRHQNRDAMLATSVNRIVHSENPRWAVVARGSASMPTSRGLAQVRKAVLRDTGAADSGIVVWQWYWADGRVITSDLEGKLALAVARLKRQSDTGLWVAVYVPWRETRVGADETLRKFAAEMGPQLTKALMDVSAQ